MKDVEVTTHGDFQVATARGENGISWAKMGTIQTDCPIKEPGAHVWFNFGRTREEARRRILDELSLLPNVELTGPQNAQRFVVRVERHVMHGAVNGEWKWQK